MKSFRSKLIVVAVTACAVVGLRAELTRWDENAEAGSKIEGALFRLVAMPWGNVSVRRPPKESRPELTKLIAASPTDSDLLSLRALEDEQQLDFAAAEKDWRAAGDAAKDKMAARVALADFFHRRLKSREEFDMLALAVGDAPPASDRFLPDPQQAPWKLYDRMIKLVDDQKLDPELGARQYSRWVARYAKTASLYNAAFQYAIAHQIDNLATDVIAAYQQAFPNEPEFPIEARAELISHTGTPARALAEYEQSFRPLWSAHLVSQYFALLKQTNSLRVFLDRTRASIAANPTDLVSAVKLFDYWQQDNNTGAAGRALAEFRQRKDTRKSAWTVDELLTLGRLYESIHDYDEAARNYYALYSAGNATAENALASLSRMMLTAPEQPMHFGAGNLSLYRDVATMDPHPGFLNGVLSLLLNNTDPANRAALEEQSAAPYFRRARAAELVTLFETRFPNSTERADLRERVIEAYSVYGSNEGVIREGTKFLTDFPNAPNRTSVALRLGDAYARTNRPQQEFALYDTLLAELAKRADNVPLGAMTTIEKTAETVRSPEYARVLDRYVSRLVSLKRTRDALTIYRREIDRNPNDPGLYDVLAAFLDQNKLGAEMEATYQRAIAQFPDHTWEHKLARWYLKQKRAADVSKITQDVVKIFSGTELDAYFQEIVHPAAPVGPALYLQLNVFAHQRFPHHLSFVRNLLGAYTTTATRNDPAYIALLREHWPDADDLRMRFFERLSRTGRLNTELAAVRTVQNPMATRMVAEGDAWRCHFEAAAPLFLGIEKDFPADDVVGNRTVAIYRSLGTIDTAIEVGTRLSDAHPRNASTLTRLGEMEADREKFDKAAAYWNRIPDIDPGKPDAYLQTATIYWDYYRYDDALRTIEDARKKLASPALFAYESGAILENQREYARAIREYARGAVEQSGSSAERRLIALGRRTDLKADVETLTDNLASGREPSVGQYRLRVALLQNQGRRADLEKFLIAVANRASAPELLSLIENEGRVDGFANVEEAAIVRQVAVTTDPVEKMQLRLGQMRFYESHGEQAKAAQTIETVYRENPAILGVVRATVDYYWRVKNSARAIDVLAQAAGRSSASYRTQFTLEAARKSVEAGLYPRARDFAAALLKTEPYRAEYIAVMADAYARAGDDRGLRALYDTKIREVQGAALPQAQKTEQIAAMRRALIPVLTRTKDFTAALDQYIEVLNRYPEDEGLAREAAAYASSNGIAARLRDYYAKATADSPKDFRWPMVLAKIQTQFEDFPAAIVAYTNAATVRPDRVDLLTGRLNLEERLLRFDEAGATAEKLYDLTYRNPEWMVRLAEIRARQGRIPDAVTALRKGWLDGRSASAHSYFEIAQKLEDWGVLTEARKFDEQAMKLVTADNREEMKASIGQYARVLAKLRAYAAAPADVIADGAANIAGVVGKYYSPEEKVKYAAWAQPRADLRLVAGAGMADVEARVLATALMAHPTAATAAANLQGLIETQKRRLAFGELGAQLEAFDKLLTTPEARETHKDVLTQAAEAYRASGNAAAEFRVLALQNSREPLSGAALDRYAQLLMAPPQRIVATIGANGSTADALVNYTLEHAPAPLVFQAITARGVKLGPQWTNAYTGLAGLYLASNTPAVRAAYPALLGEMTIGSRIGKPVDRTKQLAGDLWFYYGGRYGEYLGTLKQAGAEDYLPAMVEAAPQQSQPYFEMAEYYREAGDAAAAAADYRNALELNGLRADAHDRLATIASKAGRRDEAITEWKAAIAALSDTLNRGAAPPKFWADAGDVMKHVGEAKLLAPLRDDIDGLVRGYVHRNGSYHVDELLEGLIAASGDAAAGVAWIGEIARVAPDATQFLGSMIERPWFPETQKAALYRRIVESARAKAAASFGEQRGYSQNELWTWETTEARYLLEHGQAAEAARILAGLPEDYQRRDDVITLSIRVAAGTGTLPAQLAKYTDRTRMQALRFAAAELEKRDAAGARRVLEFVYTNELKAGQFELANFMGLAEIRLAERDVAGAVALLRRATLISGGPYSALEPAAGLLEKTGHAAEAGVFLGELAKAEPWNWEARERLAAVQGAADVLTGVAKSGEAFYATRVSAALALRKSKAAGVTATDPEIALLSSQAALTEAEVGKPYYVASRMEAAGATGVAAATRVKLLSGAIAIDPRVDAKFGLFRAAVEARQDALAVAVAGQIQPSFHEEEFATWIADQFASQLVLADRVALARGLGDAQLRLGDRRAALRSYQIAQFIQPADRIARAIETLRVQLDLEVRNNGRRPMVGDNLDQDRLVHARLAR